MVFIADDDEDDVQFVKSALAEIDSGICLKRFANGIELINGLLKANRELPDLVILDLNMPILDGRETLKMIRKNSGYDGLPVVVLTTSTQSDEKNACYSSGANLVFTKPWSYQVYLEIFKEIKEDWIDKHTAGIS
jgi:CheY-like chemotaxis protein